MRLKILLEPLTQKNLIPINYQYQLSSAVYNVMRNGSEEYANWLHEVGFNDETGKKMKLFTFSNLYFDNYKVIGDTIRTEGNAYFYFSTPYETKSLDVFVQGIMRSQELNLKFNGFHLSYTIKTVELIKTPEFNEEMNYKSITPMTVSNMTEIDGVPKVHYIRPDESEFIEAIQSNMLRKYRLLYKKDYQGELIITKIEPNRIASKLIHIKEGKPDESQIKCFLLKLNIKCSIEMHQLIYDAGIGNLNSMGLGMVEIINKNMEII